MDSAIYEQCARVAQIHEIIADIAKNYEPGEFRFARRFPEEAAEYKRFATEFNASDVPELSRMGFRMKRLILELDETDRTFNGDIRERRQLRKQLDLLAAASTRLEIACKALPIGNEV